MTRNQKYLYACHIILFLVFCSLVFVPEFFFGGKTKDYPRWFWVGTQFLSGGNLYDSFYYIYPPFSALLMALPAPLGKIGFYFTLLIVSMASWIAVVEITSRLLGKSNQLKPWQILLPILLVLPFLWENFDLGQPNVLLLALMLAGFFLLRRNSPVIAGISFGLAVAIKLFPVTVLPYLIWRRHWIASLTLVLSVVGFTFLAPAPFRGFERNVLEVQQWFNGMKGGDDGFGQRTAQNWSWKNQSLIALTHRLVRPLDYRAVDKNAEPSYINLIDVSARTANMIVLAIAGLIGAGFILLMPSYRNRTQETDNIEIAILFCLMIVASPLARNYYFVWLYFPVATVLRYAYLDPRFRLRRLTGMGLAIATAIGLLALPVLPKFFQAIGNYVIMTAILITILITVLKITTNDLKRNNSPMVTT